MVNSYLRLLGVLGLLLASSVGCCCTQPVPCGGPGCIASHLAHSPCRSGCGEKYVDEWLSNPPTADPCDSCGTYTGDACGLTACEGECHPILTKLSHLWGIRYVPSDCDSCSGGALHGHASHSVGCNCGEHHEYEGEVITPSPSSPTPSAPTPAPAPKKIAPEAAAPAANTTGMRSAPAFKKRSATRTASAAEIVVR